MGQKKVVYIAGPITGVERYWEPFEKAEDDLTALGYIPLSPSRLPQGMTNAQYMRICLAMIDSADAVLVIGDRYSEGVNVEGAYSHYVGKPVVMLRHRDWGKGCENPDEVRFAWLKHDLEEVMSS